MYCNEALNQGLNNLLDFFAQLLRPRHGVSLAVDADNGLGVTLAQMCPSVLKVNFHAIDGSEILALVVLRNCLENLVHIHAGSELKFGLSNAVLRIGSLELTHLFATPGKQ